MNFKGKKLCNQFFALKTELKGMVAQGQPKN